MTGSHPDHDHPEGRSAFFGLGHSGRLRSDLGVRWLVLGHLLVFAFALRDEEMVGMVVAAFDLSERLIFPLEIAFNLILFVAWGGLMIAWVRLVERLRREKGDKP